MDISKQKFIDTHSDFLTEAFRRGYSTHSLGHILFRAIEANIFSKIKMQSPVLDLGCGEGFFSSLIFKRKEISLGLDISFSYASIAVKRGIYRQMIIADACNLPLSNDSFMTIFSNSVLEHIINVDALLKEAARVLRRGGKFIFTVPAKHYGENFWLSRLCRVLGFKKQEELYIRRINRNLKHYNLLEPGEWGYRLRKAGLHLEGFRYYLPKDTEYEYSFLDFLGVGRFVVGNLVRKLHVPQRLAFSLFKKLLDRYYITNLDSNGGCLFLIAIKVGG